MRSASLGHRVTVAGDAVGTWMRQAVERLRRAETARADATTLNQLADEVIRARIARFDAAVGRGWNPTFEQLAQRYRDALLLAEAGDVDA